MSDVLLFGASPELLHGLVQFLGALDRLEREGPDKKEDTTCESGHTHLFASVEETGVALLDDEYQPAEGFRGGLLGLRPSLLETFVPSAEIFQELQTWNYYT